MQQGGELVAEVQALVAAGDYEGARALLAGHVAAGPAPDARVTLAQLCLADDDFDECRQHLEIAFRDYRGAGDARAAGRVAADLATLHADIWHNVSVSRGWVQRGMRALQPCGRCVEIGHLALAGLSCSVTDVDDWERKADLALELAVEFGDPDLEVRALAEAGFARLAHGQVDAGFARLEEAMAMITSGEITALGTVSKCFCSILSACDRSRDLRRAQEWTRVVGEFLASHHGRARILRMHCGAALGSVLYGIGRWPEAEETLLDAMSRTRWRDMGHMVDVCANLGELRLRQGRVEEAAALLAPYDNRLSACGPLARLHLAQGEPALAVATIRRALDELVGDRLRAAPLLALLVEVELARGAVAAAERAVSELTELAAQVDSSAIGADAALAAALAAAARGEHGAALELLRRAERNLEGLDRPVICGQVRFERARVLAATGQPSAAIQEGRGALAVFERLGARPDVDRTSALLRRLGDTGRSRRAHPAFTAELSTREREVLDLLRLGLTNAEIGERLFISAKTAEHHVGRVLSKLGVRNRAEAVAVTIGGHPDPTGA